LGSTKTCNAKKYINKTLNYTKQLLSHKNLYVKLQAIFPLTNIAARRQWLNGWGKRPRSGEYKKFHKLVFDLVKLVKENQNYKAIAKWLSHVFAYYKDLTTKEAKMVLDALKITNESAALFVYFGIFRKRHYKDQNIKFDSKKLEEKLKEMIKNKSKDYRKLQANIVWHLWKILKENRNEFETIMPYINLILEQPYQADIYNNIEIIIKDWIKDKPEVCIKWYKQMLSNIAQFVEREQNLQIQGGLWLIKTEEIIEEITKSEPKDLLGIMRILVDLWKKGVFIGRLKKIFESFKLLSDKEEQKKVKKEFYKWYNSMKKINPNIEKIDWS